MCMPTKTNTREQAEKNYRQVHYLLKCPYCGTELVVQSSNLKRKLFEPHEEEHEYWQGGFGDEFKKKEMRTVSSDPSKDVYKGIKCCNCGRVWDELCQGMYEKQCNPDGRQVRIFELNEVETERAKAFIEKHNHIEEFKAEGKMGFTALGHQFTYTITPGGFGPLVSIKCNYCGESKEITDVDNW